MPRRMSAMRERGGCIRRMAPRRKVWQIARKRGAARGYSAARVAANGISEYFTHA
jgi:hypothetical protein